MKIIIPTCNQYLFLIENLIFNFKKYWPDHYPVVVLGYSDPKFQLPDKWEFVSLGEQKGPHHWSNDLRKFFGSFGDELFINFIDDTLLTRPVNLEKLHYFLSLMETENISKLFLSKTMTKYESDFIPTKFKGLVELIPQSQYRTSIQPSICRTSFFMECLKPDMNPWQFELQSCGGIDGRYPHDTILSADPNEESCIMFSHLLRKHLVGLTADWYKGCFDESELDEEDKKTFLDIWNQ